MTGLYASLKASGALSAETPTQVREPKNKGKSTKTGGGAPAQSAREIGQQITSFQPPGAPLNQQPKAIRQPHSHISSNPQKAPLANVPDFYVPEDDRSFQSTTAFLEGVSNETQGNLPSSPTATHESTPHTNQQTKPPAKKVRFAETLEKQECFFTPSDHKPMYNTKEEIRGFMRDGITDLEYKQMNFEKRLNALNSPHPPEAKLKENRAGYINTKKKFQENGTRFVEISQSTASDFYSGRNKKWLNDCLKLAASIEHELRNKHDDLSDKLNIAPTEEEQALLLEEIEQINEHISKNFAAIEPFLDK